MTDEFKRALVGRLRHSLDQFQELVADAENYRAKVVEPLIAQVAAACPMEEGKTWGIVGKDHFYRFDRDGALATRRLRPDEKFLLDGEYFTNESTGDTDREPDAPGGRGGEAGPGRDAGPGDDGGRHPGRP